MDASDRPELIELKPNQSQPEELQSDNLPLVFLRVVAAISLFAWADSFLEADKYREIFVEPRFLFKYDGLEWIARWPGEGMWLHFLLTKFFAVSLALGFLTRLSAAALSFSIAYVLLVERQIYINHYYLLSCFCGLLAFLPAGSRLSIDSWIGLAKPRRTWAKWQFNLVRFQLAIPYVFGAFAKLNGDWMRGQPSQLILQHRAFIPGYGYWSDWPQWLRTWSVELFTYGGFAFDLLIVPLLIFKPTRLVAVLMAVFFHLTNAFTLTIGVFPWFMLATIVVFFPADFLAERWRVFRGVNEPDQREPDQKETVESEPPSRWSFAGKVAASVYVLVQLLMPLRPALYPGDSNWNERGHRFAWRMMLRHKVALTHFLIVDRDTDDYLFVPSQTVLSAYQSARADHHPFLIRQTARELAIAAKDLGVENPRIHALALVSLNGRKPTPMINPSIDLSQLADDAPLDDWLMDDPGPFLGTPWDEPKSSWWQTIELPEPFKPLQGKTPKELELFLEQFRE